MLLFALACAPSPLDAEVVAEPGGVRVDANAPIERVIVWDGAGTPVIERTVEHPRPDLFLRAPLAPGTYQVELVAGERAVSVAARIRDPGPATVRLQAPFGQGDVTSGAVVRLADGAPVRAGVLVDAHEDGTLRTSAGLERRLRAGERGVALWTVGPDGLDGWVEFGGRRHPVRLGAEVVPIDALRDELALTGLRLPALPTGRADTTRAPGRLVLPAGWWSATLDRLGVGFRVRDDLAPRAHLGVGLRNRADAPIHAVVSATFEVDGAPHPAFRPRTRDQLELEEVRRLVRVPAGAAVDVALPLYVDRVALGATRAATARVTVSTLGASTPLHDQRLPFAVERGSSWSTLVFGFGLLSACGGWALVALRLRRWLARPTAELTTLAVFASLSFVVGTASQLAVLGLGTVLGPAAPFVVGLIDDVFAIGLLAALLRLVHGAGAVGLVLLLGWLIRALAFGAAHPVDAVYLGAAVLWMEGARGLLPRGEPPGGLALVLVLAVPHALQTALGFAVSALLYRLYYADVYVAAVVVLPGLVYPAIGCALAAPFARSLARVAP